MIISMHQPEYLPYLGHIAKIAMADLHIFYDDVQYEKDNFQNRNRIIINETWRWLTVPVKNRFPVLINEVEISGINWQKKHLKSLLQSYKNINTLEDIYKHQWKYLCDLNIAITLWLMHKLKITTKTLRMSQLQFPKLEKSERLIKICKKFRANIFIIGTGTIKYLDARDFERQGIKLIISNWHDEYNPPLSSIHYIFKYGIKEVKKQLNHYKQRMLYDNK